MRKNTISVDENNNNVLPVLGRRCTNNIHHKFSARLFAVSLIVLTAQLFGGMLSTASAAVPAYSVQFIGGTPRAVNNLGQVAGWSNIGGVSRAWVYTSGSGMLVLPVPAGWHSEANDINDGGVVVGFASNGDAQNPEGGAALWRHTAAGYEMLLINTPTGDLGSNAVAINNLGDIVGNRTFRAEISPGRFTNVTRGFLLANDGSFTKNLSDLGFTALPTGINDNRQVVGGSLRFHVNTGVVEDLAAYTMPEGETPFTIIYSNAINNEGQVAASAVLSTGPRTAARFTDGVGWQYLGFQGSNDAAYGINDAGDVTFSGSFLCSGATAPLVYLEGTGTYCLEDLLLNSEWQLIAPSFDSDINNSGQIIASASNQITGETGAVLLSVAGDLPPPSAPVDLAALPHDATASQPWISIELSWTDTSSNEEGFRVERSQDGVVWEVVGTVGSNVSSYSDRSVAPGMTYDYRVFAVGLAGDSLASNIATATAPANPIDTVAPTVDFVSPVDGEQVSGNFEITVSADDSVTGSGVTLVIIEALVNGSPVNICEVLDPVDSLVSCSWNTKKLKLVAGNYQLTASASDAMGNTASTTIFVDFVVSSKGNGKGRK